MAITDNETASAVNTVVTHLLGRTASPAAGRPLPTKAEVDNALLVLVGRANNHLSAGWSPRQFLDTGGVAAGPAMASDVDERESPCPECKTGEVESVGREERETGHQPYACNAGCGYRG